MSNNCVVNLIDISARRERIQSSKQKPIQSIPYYVHKLISDFNLTKIGHENESENENESDNKRAKIFLQQMFLKKIRGQRIETIFKKLKKTHWPTTTIAPNTIAFDFKAASQQRAPDFEKMKKFITYIHEMKSKGDNRILPILFAYYTDLRLSEITRLKISHLKKLSKEEKIIELKRKSSIDWHVTYHTAFKNYIEFLLDIFQKKIENNSENGIDERLFCTSNRTIHYHLRMFYTLATGTQPDYGFGIHVFRYYHATILFQNNKRETARILLGHQEVKTTERYVKCDDLALIEKLNEATKANEFYKSLYNKAASQTIKTN